MLYCVYWCVCPRLGLFMSYLCDTLFIFIFIFIFININHLISLEQTFLFFGLFFKSSVSGVAYFLLNFFYQFQFGVAYEGEEYGVLFQLAAALATSESC